MRMQLRPWVIAVLFVSTSAFAAKSSSDSRTPRTPRTPRTQVSLEAYGEQWTEVVRPRPPVTRDPYRLTARGASPGTRFEIRLQSTSTALELPPATTPDAVRPASPREVARAVARAQNYRKGWRNQPNAVGVLAPQDFDAALAEGPEVLPRGSGYRVSFLGRDGRASATVGGVVTGLPTEVETVQRTALVSRSNGARPTILTKVGPEYGVTRTGDLAPPAIAWVQPANLFATPAYDREGGTFTKVLGLAAFPRGATLSVHNQTMHEQELARRHADPTTSHGAIQIERTVANPSGSAGIEIPGRPGDRVSVTARMPGSSSSLRTVVFTIPDGFGTPAIASRRGHAFFPVVLAD